MPETDLGAATWKVVAGPDGFAFTITDAALAQNARRLFARTVAVRAAPGGDLYGAELIFGELLANVARHAPGTVEVRLRWEDAGAILEVRDRGGGYVPLAALPDDPCAEGGRGLYLVAVYGTELHVVAHDEWTTTSVRLPVRPLRGASVPR